VCRTWSEGKQRGSCPSNKFNGQPNTESMVLSWGHNHSQELNAALSTLRPRFAPGAVTLEFLVEKILRKKVFLTVFQYSPVHVIPPRPIFTHVSSGGWTVGPLATAITQRHRLHPTAAVREQVFSSVTRVHIIDVPLMSQTNLNPLVYTKGLVPLSEPFNNCAFILTRG
jgi:hypothetical protein